ncbi:5-carboxymethyl-2-hydroxymuconate isomerase [Actinacidiphila rubida]|uniref:5-carboxymethyl-2-hydroxymuconate isomerase n=1 Tax=Actinacidiphila rubida TaxID=310780 RepID=A0A1H8NA71_9ACTN|nr:5-carboxymethyl-2-hydroxymuconate Delta-isomerase [Actinacidiphila rubida]SEO26504.1 5-carboxymethyl-2-hydroxymuconate isomerase [Actinacidiphila rubida]
MPHLTVEYSANTAGSFDPRSLAEDLHQAVVTIAGGRAGGCKTRFVRQDEVYIADGSPHYAMVHLEIALLSGRTAETKRALSAAAIDLLRRHVAPMPRFEVQCSVDIRDLDGDAYARHDEPRTEQ